MLGLLNQILDRNLWSRFVVGRYYSKRYTEEILDRNLWSGLVVGHHNSKRYT